MNSTKNIKKENKANYISLLISNTDDVDTDTYSVFIMNLCTIC